MTTLSLAAVEVAHRAAAVFLGAIDEVPAAEDVRPGWIALGSFLLMVLVTVLLWLSMRKQLGKIRFDENADEPGSTSGTEAGEQDEEDRRDEAAGGPEEHLENGDQRA
jgi:hypothetical protein